MKKIVGFIVLVCVLTQNAFADCDFSKGITENANGSYTYSRECHIQVGKDKYSLTEYKLALEDRKKEVELKDLALVKQEQRIQNWMDTSQKMSEKITTYEEMRSKTHLLYFGLGVLATGLSVWGATQIIKR